MKRGGMYDRNAKETVGCLIALILLSIVGYVVTIVTITEAVTKLLT